jgi:hypothetical protein
MKTAIDYCNESHIREYGELEQEHLDKLDHLRAIIEARTREGIPAQGDIVILHGFNRTDNKEVTYENGHLENDMYFLGPQYLTACTGATWPHVHASGNAQASGGYWISVPIGELRHVGTRRKMFWTWRDLPCGNGGVNFFATVNVWEYTDRDRIY